MQRRERIKAKGINGNGFGLTTAMAAQLWPTPRSSPNENRTTKPTPAQMDGRRGEYLAVVASTHQRATTTPDGPASRKVLNPVFVETLMGLPMTWTQPCLRIEMIDYELWEMASCRSLARLLGLS